MQSTMAQPTQPTYNPSKGYSRYSSIGATASLDPWLRAFALPVPHHWPDSKLYMSACLLCVMQPNQSSLHLLPSSLCANSPLSYSTTPPILTCHRGPKHDGTLGMLRLKRASQSALPSAPGAPPRPRDKLLGIPAAPQRPKTSKWLDTHNLVLLVGCQTAVCARCCGDCPDDPPPASTSCPRAACHQTAVQIVCQPHESTRLHASGNAQKVLCSTCRSANPSRHTQSHHVLPAALGQETQTA